METPGSGFVTVDLSLIRVTIGHPQALIRDYWGPTRHRLGAQLLRGGSFGKLEVRLSSEGI